MIPLLTNFIRLIQLAFCLAWNAMAFCLLDAPKCIFRREDFLNVCGHRLARLLESLGPTAVKMGQILSSRPDLISPKLTSALARLQDQSRPFSGKIAVRIVECALERPLDTLFSQFAREPIAAASIAQVHWARLLDGREVAVKIRRPGIEVTMERDLRLMKSLARLLSRLPWMRLVPLTDLVDETMLPVYEQLDFELEAENSHKLRRNFTGAERIVIPALLDEYCTDNILVMEYLSGLRKTCGMEPGTENAKVVALAGLRALYRMIFIDGFVHADMHAGNILVRSASELVILDTGLVTQLDEERRTDFIDFFFALVNNQGLECARIIIRNARYHSVNYSRERFERAMVELISRHSARRSKDFEIAAFVYQLADTQRRCGIRGSMDFMMIVLSMVVYDGICRQLYPACDFQSEARPYLIVGRYSHGRAMALKF